MNILVGGITKNKSSYIYKKRFYRKKYEYEWRIISDETPLSVE